MHDIEINQYEKIAPIANKDALKSKCSRRKFLRGLTFGGLFSITPASLYAFAFEPEHIRLAEVTISIQGLPANSDGIRIGHISDTHCDTDRALRRTSRAVDLLLSQKPDAIFLTGDYITAKVYDRMPKTADALAPLSKARLGAYAVMGNHDWWAGDPEFVAQSLTRAGITVLRNQSIKVRGTDLWAVGLEQRCNNLQKPDKALKLVPVDAIKLLLMHEPDYADEAPPGFALQFSGHSHGGQVRIPFLPPIVVPTYGRRYPEGLQQAIFHRVYTTRGVGMVGPKIRFCCPPEVAVLTLRCA